MAIKPAKRVSERTQRPVYDRVRGGTVNKVCVYWLAGRCTRNPCRFLHAESVPSNPPKQPPYRQSKTWRRIPEDAMKNSPISLSVAAAEKRQIEGAHETSLKTPEDVMRNAAISASGAVAEEMVNNIFIMHEATRKAPEKYCGNGLSMLAKLEGHTKAVTGIVLPCDSTKLYSGSEDNTMRVWDCNTGQCVDVVNLPGEVGSLISEGSWVLVGLPNSIKAGDTQTQTELTLNGPAGQVYAMVVDNDVLYAGTQDGTILTWKPSSQTNGLELAASLKGHSSGVTCLCIGTNNRLYSGAIDNTIRVWDRNTLECIQTLNEHTDAVMSVLCWASYLLSCSLDGTIRVWAASEGGDIEEIHTHKEEHGFLKICSLLDAEEKCILGCSCNDNTVRLYDLPSFTERGRIFANKEVRAIEIGPGGLFFTGDVTGQLTAWKLTGENMEIKATRKVSERTQRPVYNSIKGGTVNNVCPYWLAGRCTSNACRLLHAESLPSKPPKQSPYCQSKRRYPEAGVNNSSILPSGAPAKRIRISTSEGAVAKETSSVSPKNGENCFSGNGFSMVAKLEGHTKAVTGIALPCDSTKLYSGGKDNTMRVWDCNTGQCVDVVNLSDEVGSLISEGPCVLLGLPNSIKAGNTQTQTELTLDGPFGQVYAMAVDNDVLYAGTVDGTILAWKPSSQTNGFELVASMKGHSSGVMSLCIGANNRLYSSSMDNTIRVWDCNTLECIQTLNGHTDAVMSVLCWGSYLLSCSLDGTIRAWTATESCDIREIHTHKEEHGFLELCALHDAEKKPILLCSCNDNTVRLYDLPSFTERGRIFASKEVRAIEIGPGGLFFTGDATGQLTVWKLAGEPSAVAS